MKKAWPKRYRSLHDLVEAIKRDEVPPHVVSPGAAAAALDITRQSIHDRIRRGTLRAWIAEGVVLVDHHDVRVERLRKKRIAETQGELDVTT